MVTKFSVSSRQRLSRLKHSCHDLYAYFQRLSKLDTKVQTFPKQFEENDRILEDIISKIINIESNKCNYVPASSTKIILDALKEDTRVKLKENHQKMKATVEDQDQD